MTCASLRTARSCRRARRTSSCAPTPRRCRCVRWSRSRRPSSSWFPGVATATIHSTRPIARSSIRSRGSPSARDITLSDLKGTLDEFARAIFGPERETRFRPGFFPFTEPSVEVDVSCFRCGGSGRLPDGSRDPLCKGIGWIEMLLGAGMVDPNVYGFVRESGYDPDEVQRFAFGMGIERIAMLKYGVPTCASSSRTTSASWSNSDEGAGLLAALLLRPEAHGRGAGGRARDALDRGREDHPSRRAGSRGLRRRQGALCREARRTPTSSASARSTRATASGRSSAAPPTWLRGRQSRWRSPGP